jgi:hypothetical protein
MEILAEKETPRVLSLSRFRPWGDGIISDVIAIRREARIRDKAKLGDPDEL